MTALVIGGAVLLGGTTATTEGPQPAAAYLAAAPALTTETRDPVLSRALGSATRPSLPVLDDTGAHHRADQVQERLERQAAREKARRIAARQAARAALAERRAAREARQVARAEEKAQAAAEAAALQAALDTEPGTLRDMARREMLAFGYAADQWPALDALVMRESGWRVTAQNPSSGAYGLPQALPGTKMASAGADWRTNPVTQIRWMLGYIQERHIDPKGALRHSDVHGWY